MTVTQTSFDPRETVEGDVQPARVTAVQTAVAQLEAALVGLTATPAELNTLHQSGITEPDLANLHTNAAGVAALLASGAAKSAAYVKTDTGVKTFLTGSAGDKVVLVVAHVDEAFASGDTSQTTVKVGQVGTDDKFAPASAFTDKAAGAVLLFAGTLSANTNLIVTLAAAAGTGTGGVTITVLALPATA